ncbi:MAG: hypothetical protein HFG99_10680 [Dorea sp.]|nr:hypothetical protein [Dorea sp.]MCI9249583.1 hypothetical protein [Dorea sp.]
MDVRVDSALKQEAEALFNDLGLNMSSVMELQNTHCLRRNSLRLAVSLLKSRLVMYWSATGNILRFILIHLNISVP